MDTSIVGYKMIYYLPKKSIYTENDRPTFVIIIKNSIQWGSEIRPFKNRKHSKTGHFRRPVFKWSTI